ncbi:MAG TPA: hypothetical protein VJZ00_05670 [Thermoanaerobaculia bacterium]|nr:hypothetical protein [Thermoanaerobaculia bacterium]
MFGPLGERAWAGEDWQPEVLWADGPGDSEGMVFRQKGEVWVNVRFDRVANVAEYVRFGADVVTRIRVALEPRGENACDAHVRYEWVAVSEEGNAEVARRKAATTIDWEDAIHAALHEAMDAR